VAKNKTRLLNLSEQVNFWNHWNRDYREHQRLDPASERRAQFVLDTAATYSPQGPIIDIGCGTGWLGAQLSRFGPVTAIDLASEVLERSKKHYPKVNFSAGDFIELELPDSYFNFAVSLETISHIYDQSRFLKKVASILRSGGIFVLTSQNPFVWLRTSYLTPPGVGQIRNWRAREELLEMLSANCEIEKTTTICPGGDMGILKLVNERLTNYLAGKAIGKERLMKLKESFGLGQSYGFVVRKA